MGFGRMFNHNFNEDNLMNKMENSFTKPVLENMSDLERDKTLTKIAELEEEAILNYDELLQCAIAAEDCEMIALINEITNDERKHVGNLVQATKTFLPDKADFVKQGMEEFDNKIMKDEGEEVADAIEDEEDDFKSLRNEAFAVIQKDGKNWKTLDTVKGLDKAREVYNRNVKNTKNEMRLVTLKDLRELKKVSESMKNEAPLDGKSMFVALISELSPMYDCKIVSEKVMDCFDADGNYIEITFIDDTNPIELKMSVVFKDGSKTEEVKYAFDNIQATSEYISAVLISEVNAREEKVFDKEEEAIEKEENEEIAQTDKEITTDIVEEDVEEQKTESKQNEMCMMKLPQVNSKRDALLGAQHIDKYYDSEELLADLTPLIDELEDRNVHLSSEQITYIDKQLKLGKQIVDIIYDMFEDCKNEDGGTVADLGTAPILPAGSSLFPDIEEDLEDLNETVDTQQDKIEEFESLINTGIDSIAVGDKFAEDWINDAVFVFNEITDEKTKKDLYKKYSTYLDGKVKVTEAKSILKEVVDDLIKATNDKNIDDNLNKEFEESPKNNEKVTDGTPIVFQPTESVIPTVDQAIMDKAIIAASTAVTDPNPQVLMKLKESFKNIDMKTIEDLTKNQDLGGMVKYLYESSINKNEDTFTDPQMNVVDNDISTDVSGNDEETPKLADDINPAPTEVQGFPQDSSEIENLSGENVNNDEIAEDTGTEDIPVE